MKRIPPKWLDREARRARVMQAVVLASGLAAGFFANADRPLPFDVCGFKLLTGWPCPACGLTRAVCHALHGDWMASVGYHPAGILVAAGLVCWTAWLAAEAALGHVVGETVQPRISSALITAGVALSLVFWVARLSLGLLA